MSINMWQLYLRFVLLEITDETSLMLPHESCVRVIKPTTLHQVEVEPLDGLVKGLLLGKLLRLDGQVAPDCKAMLGAAVQVDLVGLAGLLENSLGLVAQVCREDLVRLGGGDGPGAGNGSELLLVHIRRVGDKADPNAVLVMAGNVLIHRERRG